MCDVKSGQMSAWAFWPQLLTLGIAKSIGDRYNSESSYNQAFTNRQCIKLLWAEIDLLKAQMKRNGEINNRAADSLTMITENLKETRSRLDELTSTLPEVIHLTSMINSVMLRDAG